ncbi:MAG: M48 family metalloprotease [Candidatus Eremiobacteraeota bacterium]|nr:M48 family metalloprotease [Candidatus Eremiobacteraeota bacterium]
MQITRTHFPHVFEAVERCASLLHVPMPLIFVRDDVFVPIVALGFGEPYSLVISSHWLDHFQDDELTFIIGRELGHVAAGHTRLTSLLSVNGRENALVSIVFGAWLRRTEYTADRFGLLCCGSLDAARRAIAVATLHRFARNIDLDAFSRQNEGLTGDSMLRLGEWFGAQPYATNRIGQLKEFCLSPLFNYWDERLLADRASYVPLAPTPRSGAVQRADCAGFGRRLAALIIDLVLVAALSQAIPTLIGLNSSPDTKAYVKMTPQEMQQLKSASPLLGTWMQAMTATKGAFSFVGYFGMTGMLLRVGIYSFVLVAIVGQTFGMMILAIKVTTMRFARPPIWLALWRYILAVVPIGIISYVLGFMMRVQLIDRLSGTRVVRLERALDVSKG